MGTPKGDGHGRDKPPRGRKPEERPGSYTQVVNRSRRRGSKERRPLDTQLEHPQVINEEYSASVRIDRSVGVSEPPPSTSQRIDPPNPASRRDDAPPRAAEPSPWTTQPFGSEPDLLVVERAPGVPWNAMDASGANTNHRADVVRASERPQPAAPEPAPEPRRAAAPEQVFRERVGASVRPGPRGRQQDAASVLDAPHSMRPDSTPAPRSSPWGMRIGVLILCGIIAAAGYVALRERQRAQLAPPPATPASANADPALAAGQPPAADPSAAAVAAQPPQPSGTSALVAVPSPENRDEPPGGVSPTSPAGPAVQAPPAAPPTPPAASELQRAQGPGVSSAPPTSVEARPSLRRAADAPAARPASPAANRRAEPAPSVTPPPRPPEPEPADLPTNPYAEPEPVSSAAP